MFPNEDKALEFQNHEHNFKLIFRDYANFESVLENTCNKIHCPECVSLVDVDKEIVCENSFTISNKKHSKISVPFIIADRYGFLVHEFTYTGYDAVVQFMKNVLLCECVQISTAKFNKYMIFGKEARSDFEKSNVRYICNNNKEMKGKHKKRQL